MASYRGAATISAIGVPPTGRHPETYHAADAGLARRLRARHRQAQDQALRSDRRPADRRHAAALHGRPDPERSRRRSPRPSAWAGGRPIRRPPPSCSRRPASRSAATPGRRPTASRSPCASWSRARRGPVMTRAGSMIVRAVAPVRHRRQGRRGAGHAADAARRRRFRHHHQLERRDLGRPPGPLLLPRQLALAVRRAARQAAAAAQLAALVATPSSTRSSSRSATIGFDDPKGDRARPRVRQARRARDADHPADVLQRLHGDGSRPTGPATRRPDDPYTDPVPNWANSRSMFVKLKPQELSPAPRPWSSRQMPGSLMRRLPGYVASGSASSCSWSSSASTSTYVITHATPIDPVEQSIAAVTSFGNTAPEAIDVDAAVAARALRPDRARRSSST